MFGKEASTGGMVSPARQGGVKQALDPLLGANIGILRVSEALAGAKKRPNGSFFGNAEEVFQDLPALWVVVIEEFRVELHTKNGPCCMLHRLYWAGFV